MSRIVIACLGVLLAGPALADDLSSLEAAQSSLQQAKQHLKAAGGGFEGHRQNALDRVNQAMSQVDAALKVARRHGRKDEKKVNKLDKKIDKLENKKTKIQGE